MLRCTSCNREVTNDYVAFNCPACGKQRIVRCLDCRAKAKPYICKECGFVGP
ncbi:MAG: DUF1610 domain-containing protein [Candidatus Diapherotrites archaeon]|nr:DUF1610 domain-containing protein [Candidatus Diapherotrites archaeon]